MPSHDPFYYSQNGLLGSSFFWHQSICFKYRKILKSASKNKPCHLKANQFKLAGEKLYVLESWLKHKDSTNSSPLPNLVGLLMLQGIHFKMFTLVWNQAFYLCNSDNENAASFEPLLSHSDWMGWTLDGFCFVSTGAKLPYYLVAARGVVLCLIANQIFRILEGDPREL